MMMMTSDPPPRTQPVAPPRRPRRSTSLDAALPRPNRLRSFRAALRHDTPVAFPWLFVALAIFATAIIFILTAPESLIFAGASSANRLATTFSQNVMLRAFAAAALAIGARQAFQHRSLEAWAFYIHRPVSAWLLFAGRCAGGLILYFAAATAAIVALAIAGVTQYAGIFFHHDFLIPTLIDALAGIPWYFAAMLAADRRARLWATRLVPLAAAALASAAVVAVPHVWQALGIIAAATALFATAAGASFASFGFTLRRTAGRLGRSALAVTLFLGFAAITAVSVTFARPEEPQAQINRILPSDPNVPTSSGIYLRTDATPVRITSFTGDHPAEWRDPAGNLVDHDTRAILATFRSLTDLDAWPLPAPTTYRQFPAIHSLPAAFNPISNRADELWYPFDSRIYVYRSADNRFLGTLGKDGFAPAGQHAAPFDGWAFPIFDNNPLVTSTPFALYDLSLDTHTVTRLFQSTPDDPIRSAIYTPWSDAALPKPRSTVRYPYLAIATAKRFLLLDAAGKVLLNLPLAHDPLTAPLVAYNFPQVHQIVLHYFLPHSTDIQRFSSDGKPLYLTSFPDTGDLIPERSPSPDEIADEKARALQNTLLTIALVSFPLFLTFLTLRKRPAPKPIPHPEDHATLFA